MKAEFIFDFASPNAYLVHKLLPAITQRTGVEFKYVPCLLGGVFKLTGNQPPWQVFADVPSKVEYEELEFKRFLIANRISRFKMNPHFPINTLALMRGACAMQMEGPEEFDKYVEEVFSAMWESQQELSDPSEVAKMLTKAGYSAEDFLSKIQTNDVKKRLMDNTSDAVERGVFGIPTMFVGQEMFFGKERLEQVEKEIMRPLS